MSSPDGQAKRTLFPLSPNDPKFQVSGSDSRSGARHVDPSRGGPKVFERLLELLNDFADGLGLRAHTLLSEFSRID